MQQQFYLQSEILSTGHRTNVQSINIDNEPMICLANQNKLELYRYAAKGITYSRSQSFLATIAHLRVLPNKHQPSDYVFLVDQKGRYGFWSALGGLQVVSSTTSQNPEQNNLFKTNVREGQDCSFCSESHSFEVLDTKGWICFNLAHSAMVIEYSITSRGLYAQKPREVPLEMIKYRSMRCLIHPKYQKLLGVIQQSEEKTMFKVYNLEKINKLATDNYVESFQKINLLEFIPANSNQVLLLTTNELIFAAVYPFAVINRFQIHDTYGRLVSLGGQLYGYIGQELILVDGNKIKSYGSFTLDGINILQDKGVREVSYLRDLSDGGRLISIATNYHELYFLILYENTWKCCKKMSSLGPIFSISETDKPNCYVTVTNTADNTYSVSLVEREIVAEITKEEDYPYFVEKLFCLRGGRAILVCSKESNNLLCFNDTTSTYEPWGGNEPLPAQVIKVNDSFYVTSKAVFVWSQTGLQLIKCAEDEVELVELKDRYAIYLSNISKEVKEIHWPSSDIEIVRNHADLEYSWALLTDYTLIVARSDCLSHLLRYKGSQLLQTIVIKDHGIISDMIEFPSCEGKLALGFVTGSVELLDLKEDTSQRFECYDNEVVHFFEVGSGRLGVLMGTKQYILSQSHGYRFQQVQLSYNYSSIHAITYSPLTNELLFCETSSKGNILLTASLPSLSLTLQSPISDSSYRISSLFCMQDEIPTVYLQGQLLFMGTPERLAILNLSSKQIIKEIPNYYKDVIGIEPIQSGVLVYGIDQLNRNILMLVSLQELEVIASVNLILKENKYIKSIKVLTHEKNITFVCRSQKFTTVYELTETHQPNELYEIKVDYQGYSLDIEPSNHLMAVTDSYRFIAIYSYDQTITPVARFVNHSEINDFAMLARSVMLGDKAGEITILEYNVENPHDALKMIMTKVGSIKVAEEVSTIAKTSASTALYGTFEGKIGKVTVIDECAFRRLRSIEEKVVTGLSPKVQFDYQRWKDRNPNEDKLVDSSLIQMYLKKQGEKLSEVDEQIKEYRQVLSLFIRLSL